MSARSVPRGIRPSRSHSRRLISAPPRRPDTMIFTPLAPAFIERWIDCFIAFLNAMRRLSCWAMLVATRYASSSGWRISLISSLTLRLVSAPICWRRVSTFWPPLPITMPGFAVCTVTVTCPKFRSISRPLTLAFERRFSTSWRIARSSFRRSVYSLSWYHFAVHVRVTPSRKPYGWTLCPMSSALPVADGDGDVGDALVDREGPTLGSRAPTLDRRALVGARVDHDELVRRQVVVVLGVRGRALQDPGDVLRGVLGHEAEERRRLLHGAAADDVDDQARLARRAPYVLRGC